MTQPFSATAYQTNRSSARSLSALLRAGASAFVGVTLLASCADGGRTAGPASPDAPQRRPVQILSGAEYASPAAVRGVDAARAASVAADLKNQTKGFVQKARADAPARTLQASENPGVTEVEDAGGGKVALNFVRADLADVVQAVLGEQLARNYAIDPGVSGLVTLQTSEPLTRSQLISTLREILRMNNAVLIETDGLYKVTRAARAGEAGPSLTFQEAVSRGLTVRVIPLVNTDVESVGKILERFAPAAGALTYDSRRNLVFSIATAEEQKSITDVISVLDVDYLRGLAFALQPLEDADADVVVRELETITSEPGASAASQQAGALRFMAIDRMNAILVVARTNQLLEEALTWVERLDQGSSTERKLNVYAVKNRRAEELARLIGQIFSVETITSEPERDTVAPDQEEVTLASGNTRDGRTGAGAQARQERRSVFSRDRRSAAGRRTFTSSGGQACGPEDDCGVRIIADNSTNSLVIYATQAEYEPIKEALERLDVLPVQVLIEATLVEVTLRNDLEFGVRWFFQSGSSEAAFSNFGNGAISTAFPGFNYLVNTSDVRVVLSALREVTDVEFISSPNMMVLDNQTARLQVGDEVPIQTRAATSVIDADAPIVNEVEYRDTGVILSVTPRVTSDGLVVLDIKQEVSEVVETSTSGIVSPTIQQRRFESTVAVGSGEAIVLGGLTRNSVSQGRTGVPGLSNVPLVGNLFTSRSNRRDRTELLVLITPRVIRDQRQAQAATDEIKRKLSGMFEDGPTQAERIVSPMKTGGGTAVELGSGGYFGRSADPSGAGQ